jgi:hypothetical protein
MAFEAIKKLAEEKDPNGIDSNSPGAKLDAGKSPVYRGFIQYFPRACLAVADISAMGASKYTWRGWESVSDGYQRYSDALGRHLTYEEIEGFFDTGSGQLHAAHAAWNALARLELLLRKLENEK